MFNRELRDLAHVHRWGILRKSRQQNVAEHSYFVAMYCIELVDSLGLRPFVQADRLIQRALTHDLGEVWTGDIPSPVRRRIKNGLVELEYLKMGEVFPHFFGLVPEEPLAGKILKVADLLEACMYLADEENLGNKSVGHMQDPNSCFGSNFVRLQDAYWMVLTPSIGYADQENIQQTWERIYQGLEDARGGLSRIIL